MEQRTAETHARRAAKAYAHAVRQLADATTERARKRHARRALNAARRSAEARRHFEALAFVGFEEA